MLLDLFSYFNSIENDIYRKTSAKLCLFVLFLLFNSILFAVIKQ